MRDKYSKMAGHFGLCACGGMGGYASYATGKWVYAAIGGAVGAMFYLLQAASRCSKREIPPVNLHAWLSLAMTIAGVVALISRFKLSLLLSTLFFAACTAVLVIKGSK